MEMAVESMEMAPGAIPRPGRVPEQRVLSPESCLRWRRRSGPVEEILHTVLGFLVWGVFVGERAKSVAPRGAHTCPSRGPTSCRARTWWRRLGLPLRFVFGVLERSQINMDFGKEIVRFREYFLKWISETKNSRKQGTGIMASC